MLKNINNFFSNTFLFQDMAFEDVCSAIKLIKAEVRSYKKKELIYSESEFEKKLGFILSGACEVKRIHSDGTALPLNTLSTYETFGIITAFTDTVEYPSTIIAKKDTEIIFLEKDDLLRLMDRYPKISLNIARFLAERVLFLNNKIHTFSGTTVEKKLANFLVSKAKNLSLREFDFNRKKTAEIISSGRASLYRALDAFKTAGFIMYDNKKIYIKDLEGLERISK